ncbi:hypothetical protein PMAYCL1PPCAC_28544 [Pristionchus mayeri]|uniref:Uncharacterized protein n=1 Tax=Pristionchus mayeri TaxID=1317129 RepID=A0AAN5IBB1_9BILA|nr:hypothetical protein PMAYCL1PPCAC_28544 [Pristionchus mayeri]
MIRIPSGSSNPSRTIIKATRRHHSQQAALSPTAVDALGGPSLLQLMSPNMSAQQLQNIQEAAIQMQLQQRKERRERQKRFQYTNVFGRTPFSDICEIAAANPHADARQLALQYSLPPTPPSPPPPAPLDLSSPFAASVQQPFDFSAFSSVPPSQLDQSSQVKATSPADLATLITLFPDLDWTSFVLNLKESIQKKQTPDEDHSPPKSPKYSPDILTSSPIDSSSSTPVNSNLLQNNNMSVDFAQANSLLHAMINNMKTANALSSLSATSSMPNLSNIGTSLQWPPNMPMLNTTANPNLGGLDLFAAANTFPTASLQMQQLMLNQQMALMRPRVNSALSSSNSSKISSPDPSISPETANKHRKRARTMAHKAEDAVAKLAAQAKYQRSSTLLHTLLAAGNNIENEKERREIAASALADQANGRLGMHKSSSTSSSPSTSKVNTITNGEFKPKLLIPEEDLPEICPADSPYRHHPKYLKKVDDELPAINVAEVMENFTLKEGEASSSSSASSSNSSLGDATMMAKLLNSFMDHVISDELAAA